MKPADAAKCSNLAHLGTVGAVSREELVEEGLRFGPLGSGIPGPLGYELLQGFLDLETAAHGQISRRESPA